MKHYNFIRWVPAIFSLVFLVLISCSQSSRREQVQAEPEPPVIPDLSEQIRQRIENLEIIDALEVEKIRSRVSVVHIYTENQFQHIWKDPDAIERFMQDLGRATEEGLNPEDYHYSELMDRFQDYSPESLVERDLLLTDAFLLYTTHLLSGKVDPVTIDANWHVTRNEGDPVLLFQAAMEKNSFSEAIRESIPSNHRYQDLKEALKSYVALEKEGGWDSIAPGPVILPGMEDVRIPLIRRRLQMTDRYTSIPGDDTLHVYEEPLEEAVLRFQRRHGYSGDGKIDGPTIEAMNVSVNDRIKQIELNLERWRWLPDELSAYYMVVNIANFELYVVRDGMLERTHQVMVGKPARETPVFSSELSYMVFNPTWTVPPTILKNDLLPAVRKSRDYLKSRNFTVLDRDGKVVDPEEVDWNSQVVNSYIYRQEPGPGNALGEVKFMFPNSFMIYLHDTPSKSLFSKTERAFSSGCIRVEDPMALAVYLLGDPDSWGPDQVDAVRKGRKTTTVRLEEKPGIHMLYWTSWVRDDILYFRKDIYERDEKLYAELKEAPSSDDI